MRWPLQVLDVYVARRVPLQPSEEVVKRFGGDLHDLASKHGGVRLNSKVVVRAVRGAALLSCLQLLALVKDEPAELRGIRFFKDDGVREDDGNLLVELGDQLHHIERVQPQLHEPLLLAAGVPVDGALRLPCISQRVQRVADELDAARLRLHHRAVALLVGVALRRVLAELIRHEHAVPEVDLVGRPVVRHQRADGGAHRGVEQQALVGQVRLVDVRLVVARVVRLPAAAARDAARPLDGGVEPRHQHHVVAQLVPHARVRLDHHAQQLHHRRARHVQLELRRALGRVQQPRGRHTLRVHGAHDGAVLHRDDLAEGVLVQPLLEYVVRHLQLFRAPVGLELVQLRQVVHRRKPDAHVVGAQVLQHHARERRLLRVHQDFGRRLQPGSGGAEREVRCWHQQLARVRLAAVEVKRGGLAHVLCGRLDGKQRDLQHEEAKLAQHLPPALQVLDERAEHIGRRDDGTRRLCVRAVAEGVERGGEGGGGRRLRRDVRTVVVEEGAHVQHLVFSHAEARLDLCLHGGGVADVAPQRVVRHAGGGESGGSLLERGVREVDAHHRERVGGEVLAAQRVVLHVVEDGAQQGAVATPHVHHRAWLARHRLYVENLLHVHSHHVLEVPLVHEAGAHHVEHAVDVQLVPLLVVREHFARRAEQRLVQPVEHRPVRQPHAEGGGAVDHELACRRERQAAGLAVERGKALLGEEAADGPHGGERAGEVNLPLEARAGAKLEQQRRDDRAGEHLAQHGHLRHVDGEVRPAVGD
mmetsp:Transcript_44175/g.101233  ORF Transcript_44175/g.101233 Transcript_44175/m.101233 type:complete len:758 (+) Transcript_44175:520-2793(+)